MGVTVIALNFHSGAPSDALDVTSRSKDWSRELSPFLLGPVPLWGGHVAKNVENAWQFSKVYSHHAGPNGPSPDWFPWALRGWNSTRAFRYPAGRGAFPEYSYWDGQCLGYVEARKKIYIPLYMQAVLPTVAYHKLEHKALWASKMHHKPLYLLDFDGYDHLALGMDWKAVLNDPSRRMGHGHVLGMLLELGEDGVKALLRA